MYKLDYIRKSRQTKRNSSRKTLVFFILGGIVGWLLSNYALRGYQVRIQSPLIIERYEMLSPLPEETTTDGALIMQPVEDTESTPTPEPVSNFVTGEASYYSETGCLGCNSELKMANGERLDDTVQTVALTPETVSKYKLLNDTVTIINLTTGQSTKARVTDTGGFGKYGRVADLSLATKNAIDCQNLCQVKVIFD